MGSKLGDKVFFLIFMSELGRFNTPTSQKIKNHSSLWEKAWRTKLHL